MPEVSQLNTFFALAFGEHTEGYICIAHRNVDDKKFLERYFQWPIQKQEMYVFIFDLSREDDVWFCPQLLLEPKRRKDSVAFCPTIWSDLDTCSPKNMVITPTITLESSPNRFQALWRLSEEYDIYEVQDASRRLAYAHASQGADKSGWDLTQLLRVPFTRNMKYPDTPEVRIHTVEQLGYKIKDFDIYPEVQEFTHEDVPFPEEFSTVDLIFEKYRGILPGQLAALFAGKSSNDDWSTNLWQLELTCFETGMSLDETFVIAKESAYNKYARDNRKEIYLWKEVCRAFAHHQKNENVIVSSVLLDLMSPLLTKEEREHCKNTPGFVEEYIDWAKTVGDAAWQYHQAGAFIILSTILSGHVKLNTSFGTVKPNMWFMILADTTLTRKTTAMDLAMDLLDEVDDNAVLATDGSIEGLMASLAKRPNRPSVFLRDEFSGLIEAMSKKDYMAGMMETLTKMYDGKLQKRILKREVIEVRDPLLLIFAGGIKTRTMELLTYEHVTSGFLPRFVFISAEADITKLRPVGPPTEKTLEGRGELVQKCIALKEHFTQAQNITVSGDKTITTDKKFIASLTPEAWDRYNELEIKLVSAAQDSMNKDVLMPTLDRLSKSGLKAAILIAASRMEDEVVVTEQDIIRAFYYVETWRQFSIEVVNNVGKTRFEKFIEKVLVFITSQPGISRAELMRRMHMGSKQSDEILITLEQRGLITRKRAGKNETLYATGEEI